MGIIVSNNLIQVTNTTGNVIFDSNDKLLYRKGDKVTGSITDLTEGTNQILTNVLPPTASEILSLHITITNCSGNTAAALIGLKQPVTGPIPIGFNHIKFTPIRYFTFTYFLCFGEAYGSVIAKTFTHKAVLNPTPAAPLVSFDFEAQILSYV